MEVETNTVFEYTESQKKVISLSSNIIKDCMKKKNSFIIKIIGSAGTGKTTIVSGILEKVVSHVPVKISVVAPTHKALSVIKDKIGRINYSFQFKTLASILKMERVYDIKTMKSDFTMGNNTENYALMGERLIIIDEASMVTKDQYNMILKLAERYKIVVVFLGDIKQLPPVKEKSSPAVTSEIDANVFSFTLTEVIRQGAGNPILNIAHNLDLVKEFKPDLINNVGYLYTTDEEAVLTNLAKSGGSDQMKYLAWSNSDVDSINLKVREKSFGKDPEELYVGEVIISQGTTATATNNQEILVDTLERSKKVYQICSYEHLKMLDAKYHKKIIHVLDDSRLYDQEGVVCSGLEQVYLVVDTIFINREHRIIVEKHQAHLKQAVQILKQLVKEKIFNWKMLVNFEEKFLKYKYAYAMTVHKSQGSTFKNVIINLRDLERNKLEFNEILYTAITRASDKDIFYYPLKKNKEENE